MLVRPALITILSVLALSECRVKFTHSSLYDEFDFVDKDSLEVEECSGDKKCDIYASIVDDPSLYHIYDSIELILSTRNMSLRELAWQQEMDTKAKMAYTISSGAEKTGGKIVFYNYNVNLIAAPLVIYVVNTDGAPNYANSVVFDAADIGDGVVAGKLATIVSAKPFTATIAGDKDTVGTIFATGYDNADANDANPDSCRRVMQTTLSDVTSFQINGPITSIYFSDGKGNLIDSKSRIKAAQIFSYDNHDLKSRGFVTSQGFIGCKSGETYRSSLYLYDDWISYELFSEKSHFVHQSIFASTDGERPVNVHTDNTMHNFLGAADLITPEDDCAETHKLEVNFNQSATNSFALVYSYSNLNCDGEVVTVPTTVTVRTTTVSPTTGKTTAKVQPVVTTTKMPVDVLTTTAKAADVVTTSSTSPITATPPIILDSTTSAAYGFGSIYLLISLVCRTIMP